MPLFGGAGVILAHWSVYCPHSIDACGSELRFRRRNICFTFDLMSASSCSDFEWLKVSRSFGKQDRVEFVHLVVIHRRGEHKPCG